MKNGIVLGIVGLLIGLGAGYTLRGQQASTEKKNDTGVVADTPKDKPSDQTGAKAEADKDRGTPRDLPAFLGPLRKPRVPKDNELTDAKIELGQMLYWDPRLSGNGTLSCASCHHPTLGWSDGLAKGRGFNHEELGRSSPTVLNAAYHKSQFWDGRAPSLEEQAKGPLTADKEMNGTKESVVAFVNSVPEYKKRFNDIFGGDPTFDTIAKAIASFERIVVDLDSPFDRYAYGDDDALNAQEKRGLELFVNKAKCATCHSGANFADSRFHNIGTGKDDVGRFAVSKKDEDKGAFRTPSVRNAAITGPYMHDGSVKTLRALIDHYEKVANEGKEKHPNLSPLMLKFKLTDEEKDDLEAFMRALTGDKRDPRINVVPALPAAE